MATYRIYIDESGDHIYGGRVFRNLSLDTLGLSAVFYPHLDAVGGRYLSLTGCIVEKDYYRNTFHPEIESLKRRYFDYDPDESPLILHRREILNQEGPFYRLRDAHLCAEFNNDLIRLMTTLTYRL